MALVTAVIPTAVVMMVPRLVLEGAETPRPVLPEPTPSPELTTLQVSTPAAVIPTLTAIVTSFRAVIPALEALIPAGTGITVVATLEPTPVAVPELTTLRTNTLRTSGCADVGYF